MVRPVMGESRKLSHTAALILQAIDGRCSYGFDIMDATGLPSGTVYPALRRMESEALVSSQWESDRKAEAAQRPARKYYNIPRAGTQALADLRKRYPLLEKLAVVQQRS